MTWLLRAAAAAFSLPVVSGRATQVQTLVQARGEDEDEDEACRLGEVVVTARDRTGRPAGGAVIEADAIARFGRKSLDQALDRFPSVSAVSAGGAAKGKVALTPSMDLVFGAGNLLDKTYALADGFPEAGRGFRLDLRARF